MRETISIKTFEEAVAFLAAYHLHDEVPRVSIGGQLATFRFTVHGDRYKGTIPSELARGIWELQEAIYKAVAFTLKGVDDIRKLTYEERQQFELVFSVNEGSSDIAAKLEPFFEGFGKGLANMSDTHKTVTIVLVAAIACTAYGAKSYFDSSAEVRKEEIKAALESQESRDRTRELEIFADIALKDRVGHRFTQAMDEGARAIMRSAPDATNLRFGRSEFTSQDIYDANQRAAKVKSEAHIIKEKFTVFGAETRHNSSTKYTLGGPDGTEFNVVVNHEFFTQEELDKLWLAAKNRTTVLLEVNLTINKGNVKAAQIVQVF